MTSMSSILHKGFVSTCAVLTIGSLAYTGGLLYQHYYVNIPDRERKELADSKPSVDVEMKDTAKILKV